MPEKKKHIKLYYFFYIFTEKIYTYIRGCEVSKRSITVPCFVHAFDMAFTVVTMRYNLSTLSLRHLYMVITQNTITCFFSVGREAHALLPLLMTLVGQNKDCFELSEYFSRHYRQIPACLSR